MRIEDNYEFAKKYNSSVIDKNGIITDTKCNFIGIFNNVEVFEWTVIVMTSTQEVISKDVYYTDKSLNMIKIEKESSKIK